MPETPKEVRIKNAIDAEAAAEAAAAELEAAAKQLEDARAKRDAAAQLAEQAKAEAEAEERIEAAMNADANEKKHKDHCAKQCKDIHQRKKAREAKGEAPCDPRTVKVVAIDDLVHNVVAGHELKLGARGFHGGEPRPGSRFKVACGPSIDAPDDELDHPRFDQTQRPNCLKCGAALAMMDTGEIADTRGDFLTSKEQIAHVRAETATRNKASSARRPG